MAIILKDQTPSGVPTPDSGKTAIITDAGELYIKDDTGAVTHITSGGTVTSVGVSSANNAITVTSSPITTSGTISLTANTFTSTDPGVVPGSGGGTANFLRADGTWASPPNSGGTVTSVDVSGSNGIGVSGSPITSSGTISLSLGDITPTSVAASGTVTGSNLSGTNTGDQTITLTGDVTGSGTGSFATTIAAEAVSLSKMANLAANSIIGNNTGSAATPVALTQAQFTAMVNTFSSSLSGAVPASGGGTTNFLRADGTWAAPAGGGTPGGSNTQVQFNNSGAFGGSSDFVWSGTALKLGYGTGPGRLNLNLDENYISANVDLLNNASPGIEIWASNRETTSATASGSVGIHGGTANTGQQFGATLTAGGATSNSNGGKATIQGGSDFVNSYFGASIEVEGNTGSTHGGVVFKTNSTTRFRIDGDGSWDLAGSTGTSGQVLTSSGSGSAPTWQTVGGGTVTSINASGGSTGLSFSGGPITTSGTLTLGGTLAIANGGTGQTSKTDAFDALAPTTTTGDLIYYNGTDNVRLGIGSNGQVLTVASGSPAWAAPSGGGSVNIISPFLLMGA